MTDKPDPRATFPPHIEEGIRDIVREEMDRKEKGLPQKDVPQKDEGGSGAIDTLITYG